MVRQLTDSDHKHWRDSIYGTHQGANHVGEESASAPAERPRGALTRKGKERARAANLRHGYYSKSRDEALEALGEDPKDLERLIAGAYEQFRPSNGHQAWVTERMARLEWRLQRSDRMQESLMADRVSSMQMFQDEQNQDLGLYLRARDIFFGNLEDYPLRPDFYTPPGVFKEFDQAYGQDVHPKAKLDARGEAILYLLYRLRKPQELPAATGPLPEGTPDDEDWQERLEMLEDDADYPMKDAAIPIAEGEERAAAREELQRLGTEAAEVHRRLTEKPVKEKKLRLTGQDRDVFASQVQGRLSLMRRDEASCFREFWRLGHYLMGLQKQGPGEDVVEEEAPPPQPDPEPQPEPELDREPVGEEETEPEPELQAEPEQELEPVSQDEADRSRQPICSRNYRRSRRGVPTSHRSPLRR
jgi:hypothetical protein